MNQQGWPTFGPSIEFINHSTVCVDTGVIPYFAYYGKQINLQFYYELLDRTPAELTPRQAIAHFGEWLEFMRAVIKQITQDTQTATEKRFNKIAITPTFVEDDRVFLQVEVKGLSTKHSLQYSGSWTIVDLKSPLVWLENIYTGRLQVTLINRPSYER